MSILSTSMSIHAHGVFAVQSDAPTSCCIYRCVVCESNTGEAVEIQPSDVLAHIMHADHRRRWHQFHSSPNQQQGDTPSLMTVKINGIEMRFDNDIIFPELLFGDGACLFDNTLQMLPGFDRAQGIHLMHGHEYFVVTAATTAEENDQAVFAMPNFAHHKMENFQPKLNRTDLNAASVLERHARREREKNQPWKKQRKYAKRHRGKIQNNL